MDQYQLYRDYKKDHNPGDSIRQSDPKRLHKDPAGIRVVDRHSDL
jgi:hypothetical protein